LTIKEEVEHLLNVDLFAGIERERLRLLALTSIEPVSYEAGDLLFRQGDVADSAYIVVEGRVELLIDTPRGKTVAATIGSNGIVGETSLLCASRRRATARAAGPVRTLRIAKDAFEHLLSECPDVALKLLRTMARQHEVVIGALGG
jgi:CRP-like cAMP-binding protein